MPRQPEALNELRFSAAGRVPNREVIYTKDAKCFGGADGRGLRGENSGRSPATIRATRGPLRLRIGRRDRLE